MVQTQIIIIVTIIAIIIDPRFIESKAERPRSEDKDKEQLIIQLLHLNKTQCSDERAVGFELELKSICRQIRMIILESSIFNERVGEFVYCEQSKNLTRRIYLINCSN